MWDACVKSWRRYMLSHKVIHLISINNIIHMVHKKPKHPCRESYISISYAQIKFKHESKDIKKMNHVNKKGQINPSQSPPQTLQSNDACQQWTSLVSDTSQQFFFKVHIRGLPYMCDAFVGNCKEEICYFLKKFLHFISFSTTSCTWWVRSQNNYQIPCNIVI